jgi:hypothetical protein
MANAADLMFDDYDIASRLPKVKVPFNRGYLYILIFL